MIPALQQPNVHAPRRADKERNLWSATFDGMPDPIFLHDDEFRIVHANRAYLDLVGLPVSAVVGRFYWTVFPRRDGPLPGCLEVISRATSDHHDEEFVSDAGEVFRSRSFAVYDDEGRFSRSVHVLENVTERRVTEDLKHRLGEALRQTAEGIVLLDDELHITYVNRAAAELVGRPASVLVGQSVAAVIPEHRYFRIDQIRQAVDGAEQWTGEVMLAHAGGESIPVQLSAAAIRDAQGRTTGYVGAYTDLRPMKTSQRQTEALRGVIEDLSAEVELETVGRKAVAAALQLAGADVGAVALLDETGETLERRWIVGLPQAAIGSDFRAPFPVGHGIAGEVVRTGTSRVVDDYTALPDPHPACVAAGVRSMIMVPIRAGEMVAGVLLVAIRNRVHGFSGDKLPLVEAISRQLGVALRRDRLLTALRGASAQLTRVTNAVPDVLFELSVPDLAPRFVSPAADDVLGYRAEEFISDPGLWRCRLHPDDRERVFMELGAALAGGEGGQIEGRFIHRDGETVLWGEGRVSVERDAHGTPVAIFGVLIDITLRKQAENALRYRLEFEQLIAAISSRFVNVSPENVDGEINAVLELVGRFSEADRVYVFQYSSDHATVSNTHEWCREGIKPVMDRIQNMPVADMPWLGPRHLRGEIVHLPQVAALPEEAGAERAELTAQGIQSLVCVPLSCAGKVLGFVGCDAVREQKRWSDDVIALHKIVGETLAAAVERIKAETAQRASAERYRLLFNKSNDAILVHGFTADGFPAAFTDVNDVACRMLGYNRTELLRLRPQALDMPNGSLSLSGIADQMMQDKHIMFLNRNKTTFFEINLYSKSGQIVPVEVGAHLFELHGEPTILFVVRDISERRRAEVQRQQSEARLTGALQKTIQAAALTIEKRDPYTAGHQRRVADLAAAIALELDLDESQVEGIRLGATIHDIGKIYIPAEIINRPGKLSFPEQNLVRTHSQVGFDIVRGIDFPWPVADLILQHHERMDGSGYPGGLKGNAICLEARIVAVADTVEAMVSHRPFRAAMGMDKALEEIHVNRGRLYDAAAADACLRLFQEGRFEFSR